MKIFKYVLWSFVFCLPAWLPAHAREVEQQPSPPKYRMELVYVFEGETPEFIFVIGSAGFKSVASLKKFVSGLPAGSTLEWSPGCVRMGAEPLLSSAEDMEEFKQFCAEHAINFILVPSG
ncbi:MAG TPA: hypothetical protein VGX92_06355 [Pyrinomonadaceae bacterium]|jgi:hypothetical protein|nr:hypothetical protein [Pyrinomonadaceae bacterium]